MKGRQLLWPTMAILFLSLTSGSPLSRSRNQCKPWTVDMKPRIFVMSDISNEPDDTMSFVRLLTHADMYDIQGMVAVTSYWQNNSVYPDQIRDVVRKYGKVYDNLRSHGHGFHTEEYLLSVISKGYGGYGMAAIDDLSVNGSKALSPGAKLFIKAVDASTLESPLYLQIWGGSNTLAQALYQVNATRSSAEASTFYSKFRVYAISDQDNTGLWIRQNFPKVRYIASIHGWNFYGLAAWTGISGEKYYGFDHGGPDTSLVSDAWIRKHIQVGPLGSAYPNVSYIMEGDSPSILYTMQNGLNVPEHPEYGGWGGRYFPESYGSKVYTDAVDHVVGQNGQKFLSNHATIWRWREAYQNEIAARIQWTLKPKAKSSAPHPPIVVVNGSCGSTPLEVTVKPKEVVTLDASASYDADGRVLDLEWMHYREITATQWWVEAEVPLLNFTKVAGTDGKVFTVKMPSKSKACLADDGSCQQYHAVLEVKNKDVDMPLTRYKRVILKVVKGD